MTDIKYPMTQISQPGIKVQRAELAEFLVRYVERGFNFRAACQDIQRDPTTIYAHLRKDEQFAAAFEETKRLVGDVAYAEAIRRAIDGTEKPIYQGGELVGYVTEYSDTLLARLLEATRQEFKPKRALEVSGPDGGAIEFSDTQLAAKLTAVLAQAKRRMLMGDNEDVIDGEIVDDSDVSDLL